MMLNATQTDSLFCALSLHFLNKFWYWILGIISFLRKTEDYCVLPYRQTNRTQIPSLKLDYE